MRRLAVLATLVALSGFALAGSALAQDDGGGSADSGAATTANASAPATAPDTPAPAATPDGAAPDDATVLDDATAASLGCPAGSTKGACAALTNTDPFAAAAGDWKGTSYDTAPPPGTGATARMGAAR